MEIHLTLLVCLFAAVGMSLYAIPVIVRIVKHLGLLDHPNERSSTKKSVPTLGGIAIFISFILSSTIGLSMYDLPEIKYILPALILILFVGLSDDILNMSPYKKFFFQVTVAVILVFMAKIRFTSLHGTFGIWEIGEVTGSILACFTIIVITNAFNLIDGIDGLASGITMLIATVFGIWFYISGYSSYAILSFSLVGAVLGFFYFNVYGVENKIFMGDTGSLVIGTIVSILVIRFNEFNIDQSQQYAVEAAPAISFGILSYPLMDIIRVIIIRMSHFRHPFQADKNHFHHRLLTLGLSHRMATLSIIGFNILFIIAVFYLNRLGFTSLMFYILVACIVLVMVPAFAIQKQNLIREDDPVQQLLIPGIPNEVKRDSKKQKISGNEDLNGLEGELN